MSRAFKCTKCGGYYDGEPVATLDFDIVIKTSIFSCTEVELCGKCAPLVHDNLIDAGLVMEENAYD